MGHQRTPHMILYHINIGFPAVEDNTRLISPTLSATPRDAEAEAGKEKYNRLQPPTKDYAEKCYFHDMKPDVDGKVTTAMVNSDLDVGYGVYWTSDQQERP